MTKKPRTIKDSLLIRDFLEVDGQTNFGANNNAATSGSVIIPITELYSGYTTNATDAITATLADGKAGQIKIIKLVTKDTNNMVITPANFSDGTTIMFDATGEVAILVFDSTNWQNLYTNATIA